MISEKSKLKSNLLVTIAILNFFTTFAAFESYSMASTVNLPQTGQTNCYDINGTIISCTGTGQDGDKQGGVAWPNPRFSNNGDGTITDNLTGLIWLKDANCFGSVTWATALTDSNSLASGQCGLTDGSHAGDWRLPNADELLSLPIYQYSNVVSWLNSQGFTNVQWYGYWSSTTLASNPLDAWTVNMRGGDGGLGPDYKTNNNYYVWPVRGGQ